MPDGYVREVVSGASSASATLAIGSAPWHELEEFFEEDITLLEPLLGRDPGSWCKRGCSPGTG